MFDFGGFATGNGWQSFEKGSWYVTTGAKFRDVSKESVNGRHTRRSDQYNLAHKKDIRTHIPSCNALKKERAKNMTQKVAFLFDKKNGPVTTLNTFIMIAKPPPKSLK
jgi:hypothetical protein